MKSIDLTYARKLAQNRINKIGSSIDEDLDIMENQTLEIDLGWIFFFNTKDFIRTGNFSDALAGNAPILITREGVIHELPTSIPWEIAVKHI
ncbi:MAG: YrhB domain-containing protein [Aliidongia sp.]